MFSLLNKNNLSCLQPDAFRHQRSLLLLSLYDNRLETLPRGVFSRLTNLASM